jgi:hypothetical protein
MVMLRQAVRACDDPKKKRSNGTSRGAASCKVFVQKPLRAIGELRRISSSAGDIHWRCKTIEQCLR